MPERGINLPPSQFEAMFLSTAHTNADIDCTITAVDESCGSCRANNPETTIALCLAG